MIRQELIDEYGSLQATIDENAFGSLTAGDYYEWRKGLIGNLRCHEALSG